MDKLRQAFEQYSKQYPARARLDRYEQDAQRLLDEGNDQDLLQWMIVHIKEARVALDKGDIDHFALAFERVIQHRIKAGIPSFEESVKREFPKKGGKGKRGSKNQLNETLGRIAKAIGSASLNDVLDAIEDDDHRLESALYSNDNPAPIIIDELDRVNEILRYRIRATGAEKTSTFGNINNHLTDFR